MQPTPQQKSELKKSCVNCGAALRYAPGTKELKCEYCDYTQEIPPAITSFEELELKPYLDQQGAQSHSEQITMLHCKNCGANQHVEENYKSLHCVYCSMPLIIEDAYKDDWILPGAVLPFQMNQKKAHLIFKKWVSGLWWAPNNLQKAALDPQHTKGLYAPFWTFDAQLTSNYSGQRGEYYYVTKTVGSGKNRRTVQERRTRWYPAGGAVSGFVDDTLIKASNQKSGVIPAKVAKWNLKQLETFDSAFLSGYVTEKYTIPLIEGHLSAKGEAQHIAKRWIHTDIGGDEQRIDQMDMNLSEEKFKHILLPIYISAYAFNGKRYNFFVNGQSGAISGERPYSFWKIFLFVLMCLVILGVLIFLINL
jgi:DNA-directed RNA polymerase subunit RPC12/RpoP